MESLVPKSSSCHVLKAVDASTPFLASLFVGLVDCCSDDNFLREEVPLVSGLVNSKSSFRIPS